MSQPPYGPPQNYGGPPPGWGPPAQGGWQQPPQQPQGWGAPSPQDQQWAQQQWAQQQWGQPQQQAPQQDETPPVIPGTLADFYGQPSTGGGAALRFHKGDKKGPGYFGIVSRAIQDSDTQQQTGMGQNKGKPAFFRDGRPKMVLKIPLNIRRGTTFNDGQSMVSYDDGQAQWWCGPGTRDQLVAAIAASGAPITTHPSGVQYYIPEPGSGIYVEKTGTRPTGPDTNPASTYNVQYYRPEQAKQIAAQQGIEYPSAAELATVPQNGGPGAETQPPQATLNAPGPTQGNGGPPPFGGAPQQFAGNGGQFPMTQGYGNGAQPSSPANPPTSPPPSVADFAPPNPGQPGNAAQWGNDVQGGGTQQFPTWNAVDNQPNPGQPNPVQQGPANIGAPPEVNWQGNTQQPAQGYIPQATPPGGPLGMTEQGQQLMASLTGQPVGPGGQQ